jgi:glycosyltransferase involved in cell wall biosynthesis
MKRLAIITTHPIQYYAPVFKLLQQRQQIVIKVFYTWGQASVKKHDPGFGTDVEWDIPLLDGYDYEWVENTSAQPGSHHYKGVVNPQLNAQIAKWQPNALLVFGWAYHSHIRAMRYFKNKIPVYFRGDSTLLDELGGIKSLLKSFFLKWVYHHVDHAFYVGTNNKAYFKKYGLKDKQLSFAPHAVDNARFMVGHHPEAVGLRKDLGINTDDIVILFAGKLEDKKDPQLLLDAFLTLKYPGVHLLIVGNGALEEMLKAKAVGHQNIHFINFQNQSYMPVVYQSSNIFCLPSKGPGESWGLAVNEAMAGGLATLASNKVGCAADLVKNDYNGIVFKNGDRADLIACLNRLLQSKQLLANFGKNAATLIADWNFTNIALAIETKLINEAS